MVAVARHEEPFHRRADGCQALRQFPAAHLRHDDVGHEQMNIVRMMLGDTQRLDAMMRFEDDVPMTPEHLACEHPHRVLVFDEQDRFPSNGLRAIVCRAVRS